MRSKPGPKPKTREVLPVTPGRPSVSTGDPEVDQVLTALYDATDGYGWSCQETALMAVQFAHLYVETERARKLYSSFIRPYTAHASKADIMDAQRCQALWLDLFKELKTLGVEFGLTPQAIAKLPKPNTSKKPKAIDVEESGGKDDTSDNLRERGL